MKRVYVGDIHGAYSLLPRFRQAFPDADEIICVGDFGIGFNYRDDKILRDYGASITTKPVIRTIRGNHDSPEVIKKLTTGGVTYIPDGTIEDGILYVGGAFSVDHYLRSPGVDWWRDEELSDVWWYEFLDTLEDKEQIHTVVSHDCPDSVLKHFNYPNLILTKTGGWLEELRNELPNVKLWLFGHHHRSLDVTLDGTRFVCIRDGGTAAFDFESGKLIEGYANVMASRKEPV